MLISWEFFAGGPGDYFLQERVTRIFSEQKEQSICTKYLPGNLTSSTACGITMELYNLGMVPWQQSQLLYHALAHLGREALCICSPATPYFSIGCHQDISEEVNLDFCGRNNIPVFRREVGGGGVYLDSNQVFFQIILHRRSPHVSMCRETFYRKFLEPVVMACRSMGIAAHYGRMGDLAVEDQKIGGTGAGEIGDCVAFVGNIIVDFHFDTMSRILKVPNEGFQSPSSQGQWKQT